MKRYLKTVKPDEAVKKVLESVRAIEGAERLAVYECQRKDNGRDPLREALEPAISVRCHGWIRGLF